MIATTCKISVISQTNDQFYPNSRYFWHLSRQGYGKPIYTKGAVTLIANDGNLANSSVNPCQLRKFSTHKKCLK